MKEFRRYRLVYICSPLKANRYHDELNNIKNCHQVCAAICEKLADKFIAPLAPQLLFPRFLKETPENRPQIMDMCMTMLTGCDEVWVFPDYAKKSGYVSSGMRQELALAAKLEKPIKIFKQSEIENLVSINVKNL